MAETNQALALASGHLLPKKSKKKDYLSNFPSVIKS